MRRFRNVLVFPRSQIKLGVFFIGVTSLVHLVLTAVAILTFDAWLSGKQLIGTLPFWQVLAAMGVIYLFYLGFVFWFNLYISHRWLGPLVAIERYVRELENGTATRKLTLRTGDEEQLVKIANALNRLADKIQPTAVAEPDPRSGHQGSGR